MRRVGSAGSGVTAQRDDMTNAGIPVIPGDGVHFFPRRADAGEVGRRHEIGLPHQPRHGRVGAGLGGPAGAVGHRHEARRQRLQPPDA